jgi:hypothetical protein
MTVIEVCAGSGIFPRRRRVRERRELVGRDQDLAVIRAFVDELPAQGGALLFSGEPGIGKSALLDGAEELAAAAGVRALRAAGAESEDVSYFGLNQLLYPLRGDLNRLDGPHRNALNVALGLCDGPACDRLVVSNAALALLGQASADGPLLLIVDNLQWVDQASALVLGFIARRLRGSQVGLIAAERTGSSFLSARDVPGYEVQPLGPDASARLAAARFPGLAPSVRRRIVAEARGNPLVLLELPSGLSERQRSALAPLPVVLPLSGRLRALVSSRVSALPATAGYLLLLAVLERTGDLSLLRAAAAGQCEIGDLAHAEQAGLVRVDKAARRVGTPGMALQLLGSDAVYGDLTVPQEAAGNRRIPLPTGRGLGGGSSVNTMTWFQGHPADYDGWREQGADGWGWEEMLPVARGVEHHILGRGPFHGAGGPMTVDFARDVNPLATAFIAAGEQLGLPVSGDLNGAARTGFGIAQSNIRDGVRHSVVDGYLRPALSRPNLIVRTSVPVVRVLFDGRKATGVRLRNGEQVTARRGVILTAGSLRTPQLLMLSGVGPAAHLRAHGIPVLADLPGVGANLHDHPMITPVWPVTTGTTLLDAQDDASRTAYRLARRGPLASVAQALAVLPRSERCSRPRRWRPSPGRRFTPRLRRTTANSTLSSARAWCLSGTRWAPAGWAAQPMPSSARAWRYTAWRTSTWPTRR